MKLRILLRKDDKVVKRIEFNGNAFSVIMDGKLYVFDADKNAGSFLGFVYEYQDINIYNF